MKLREIASQRERSRWLLPWLFASGLAGYQIVSYVPAILGLNSRVASVPFRAAILGASLWVVWRSGANRNRYRGWLWVPLALFWILYGLRMLADLVYFPVPVSIPPQDFVLLSIGTCLIPMLPFFQGFTLDQSRQGFRALLILSSVSSAIAFIYNAHQLGQSFGRLYGNEYLNPITLGHSGVTLVALCIWSLLQPSKKRHMPATVLWSLLGIGLACVALAASRGPVLALALMLLMMMIAAYRRGQRLRLLAAILLLIVTFPAITNKASEMGSGLVGRIEKTQGRVSDGKEQRLTSWKDAWKQFEARPWLGSGLEEKHTQTYPHNIVVEAFMATGVFGGVALVVLLIAGFYSAWVALWRAGEDVWISMIFVQQVVLSMLSGAIYTRTGFWCTLALIIANRVRRAREVGATRRRFNGGAKKPTRMLAPTQISPWITVAQ